MLLENFLVFWAGILAGSLPFKFLAGLFSRRASSWRITSGSFDTARLHFLLDPWLALLLTTGDIFKAVFFARLAAGYFDSYFLMILAVLLFLSAHVAVYLLLARRASIILPLFGLWLVFLPKALMIFLVLYLITIIFFKYLKIGFVLNILFFPLVVYFSADNLALVILALLQLIMILILYFPSIHRFFAGEEKSYLEMLKEKKNKKTVR